jgi:hypothetical protein
MGMTARWFFTVETNHFKYPNILFQYDPLHKFTLIAHKEEFKKSQYKEALDLEGAPWIMCAGSRDKFKKCVKFQKNYMCFFKKISSISNSKMNKTCL